MESGHIFVIRCSYTDYFRCVDTLFRKTLLFCPISFSETFPTENHEN